MRYSHSDVCIQESNGDPALRTMAELVRLMDPKVYGVRVSLLCTASY